MSYTALKRLENRVNRERGGDAGTRLVLTLVYRFSDCHIWVPHPNTLRRALRDEALMKRLIKGYNAIAKEEGLTPRRIRQIEARERKKLRARKNQT